MLDDDNNSLAFISTISSIMLTIYLSSTVTPDLRKTISHTLLISVVPLHTCCTVAVYTA